MKKISELLAGVKSAAIAGHVNPDGDCVGSCLGLYNYIRDNYPEISVKVYMETIPDAYTFVSGSESVLSDVSEDLCDVFFALDSGDAGRIGVARSLLASAGLTVCVDHHISNTGYADINDIRPQASSTSEVIYEIIKQDGGKMMRETAEALYLGIVQDTGVFQYTCTGVRTMEIAGDLMSYGIDFSRIIQESFFQKTYTQNLLLGYALTNSRLTTDGRFISSVMPADVIKSFGALPSDLDGIVSQLRNTKGTDAAVFLYESEENTYKVSLRTEGVVDASKTAVRFGGGGHKRAAGCTVTGESEEIISRVLADFCSQITGEGND